MKKALIVSNSSGLVTLFLKNDVELLIQKGYSIDVACNTEFPDANTDSFFENYNITVKRVPFPIRNLDGKLILDSIKELKKIMHNNTYDIVHCHSTIAATLIRMVAQKYRKKGMKIVYTSHGFPFYEGNSGVKAGLFKLIERNYSKYTDAILTICKEDYENAKKMKCKNVYLMHGVGVDLARFRQVQVDRSDYRHKLGIDDDEIVILSIGELNANKNHCIVIKALAEMEHSHITYAICGREVTEIGKKAELENLAKQLNVKLLFLGFRKDIPEICLCADVGALPSFKEGLGLSGIEMLASGLPVAGSNRQGIKDYIINGKTGYLADPNDSSSFKKAIGECMKLRDDDAVHKSCIKMANNFGKEQARMVIKQVYDELGL